MIESLKLALSIFERRLEVYWAAVEETVETAVPTDGITGWWMFVFVLLLLEITAPLFKLINLDLEIIIKLLFISRQ
jgi:hypothetical protein